MKKFLIFIILAIFSFAGCAPTLEYGFDKSNYSGCIPINPYKCAYILSQTEFEKDNVFVDMYYGDVFRSEIIDEENVSDEVLENPGRYRLLWRDDIKAMYDTKEWRESIYIVKELSYADFYKNKYTWKGKEGYCERLNIPEELFDSEEGYVLFFFAEYYPPNDKYYTCASVRINYKMDEDKVILSVPEN